LQTRYCLGKLGPVGKTADDTRGRASLSASSSFVVEAPPTPLRQQLKPSTSDGAWWLRAAGLVIVYVLAGKFGLAYAFLNASATAVWPPTGIALVALLLFGVNLWPAVLVGAFIVSITTVASLPSALGIAIGNTLEAILGAVLVNRFANGARAIERAQDLIKLALLTGLVAAPVSATIGVTTLWLTGAASWNDYVPVWITWWLGDSVGAWLLAPLLLTWILGAGVTWTRARAGEAVVLLATLATVAGLVFGGLGLGGGTRLPFEFLCMPVLLWAAFRLGPRETMTAVAVLSLIALNGTLLDIGPFARASRNEALVLLQTFMGMASVTAAAIAALVQDQRRAEERVQAFNRDLESRVEERTEELARSEERLMEAQRVGHIGSWEWDVMTDRVWWSDELERIFGVSANAVQSYPAFLERVYPDDRRYVDEAIERALAERQAFGFEHRVVRPDGTVRTVYARGHVVVDASGRAVRMTGIGQDITESKRLEAERAELFREQAARREAEQANRLKDAFLATLSHELRTPLNAIVGWLQILRTREFDAPTRSAIDVLDRNATTLRRLIEDMLDVSAILSGKLHIHREPVDLTAVVEGVIDSLRPGAEAKQVGLQYPGNRTPIIVDGDLQRLQQVVTNLLSNALKFTASGGWIVAELRTADSTAVLRVSDTGVGISPDVLPFIFDAFRQADPSLTRMHGGLGLGLAIVRDVVELHGGTVQAESSSDRPGATFVVNLPLASRPAWEAESAPAIQDKLSPTLAGLHVLAVDDDEDSRDLLTALFGSAGANFVAAGSARDGLTECERHHLDLLLVDLAMPEQDGYAFLARAREQGVRAPAIAITAYADDEHRARAFAAGFDAHLPKPIALDELLRTVALVVGRPVA
jgi:PAS domain S-box-containing protein